MKRIIENPNRLEVLCGEHGILRSSCFKSIQWFHDPPLAPLVDVLRVHEYRYIHKLVERVKETQTGANSTAFKSVALDAGDTQITRDSWNAALGACGCVLKAVDLVCSEKVRNAFCAVRPPGHHLGPSGACNTEDLEESPNGSQGFCLLNNVAVGAAYACCIYRNVVQRVAIIDFDVHHGNGTEAIVKNIEERQKRCGLSAEVALLELRARVMAFASPTCKAWLDPQTDLENIFFASIHGYGGGFYPGTGADCDEATPRIINVALSPGSGSSEFRSGLRTRILPELFAFSPDIIFVSAGFDGHGKDLVGNCRLEDEDYVWVTQQLVSIANRCCGGRLVSVLEGGYNTQAGTLSPFAQSVACHVHTLMYTTPSYCCLEFGPKSAKAVERRPKRRRLNVENLQHVLPNTL